MHAFRKAVTSDSSSEYSNIFKSFGKRNDYICNLNKLYKDIHYKRRCNTVTKTFLSKETFDWELYIIYVLHKMELNIHPEVKNIDYYDRVSHIEYDCTNLKSLREIFETSGCNFHYIINELLSFLRIVRNKKVLIGNLHIDSIYMDTNTMKFYIMDLANTTFSNNNYIDISLQSLYISLHDACVKDKIIKYFEKEMDVYNKDALSKSSYTDSIIDLYNKS